MKKLSILLSVLAVTSTTRSASAAPSTPTGKIPPGYRIETISIPEGTEFGVGGIDFAADGTLYLCTRDGDVWTRKEANGKVDWHVFASGLHEPLGVCIDKKSGHVFVAQRTELTELVDEDGTGTATLYRRVNGDWGFSGNYHEFAHGPVRDSKGNFYITLNLAHTGKGGVQGSIMGHIAPYRGWTVQITPDGKFVPFASGFRSPVGITVNDKDEIFVMDSQGDWEATSPLYHVEKDRFYGHPASMADHPDYKGKDLNAIPTSEWTRIRTLPILWVPYGELANCPCQPVFDGTKGKFGPFGGQIFFGDQTKSNIMRAVLEKVGGEYQGAIFDFAPGLKSGYIRGAFAADGSFWMGEVDHGWGSAGGKPFALERVVWDGKTVPFEFESINLTPNGFKISFTKPVDPTASSSADLFKVKHWHYLYHGKYGSPKIQETVVPVSAATVSKDGLAINLSLPLEAGEVYQIDALPVKSTSGEVPAHVTGWYTLNRLLK